MVANLLQTFSDTLRRKEYGSNGSTFASDTFRTCQHVVNPSVRERMEAMVAYTCFSCLDFDKGTVSLIDGDSIVERCQTYRGSISYKLGVDLTKT